MKEVKIFFLVFSKIIWIRNFNFFFSKQGCEVKDITHQPQWADTFALVVDNYSYEHNKTSFNELTLFGPSSIRNKYSCDGNLEVYILERELNL